MPASSLRIRNQFLRLCRGLWRWQVGDCHWRSYQEIWVWAMSLSFRDNADNLHSWKRNDYVISTKINWGGSFGDNPANNYGLSRKHIVEGTNMALKRLGLDYGKQSTHHTVINDSNIQQSTLSMPTVPTATPPSKKPSAPSTISLTKAKPSTGAPPNGTPTRSPQPGVSPTS